MLAPRIAVPSPDSAMVPAAEGLLQSFYARIRDPEFQQGARRQIVFLHIAKTAGTSVGKFLELAFPGGKTLHESAEFFDLADQSQVEMYDVVRGHISREHFGKLRRDNFVFTFLRDPVDRVLSIYYFLRERDHPNDEFNGSSPFILAKHHSLIEFLRLESPAVKVLIRNHQTYALGADWRFRSRNNDCAVLRRAKRTLDELDFYGLTERFDESIGLLSARLGVPVFPKAHHENATSVRHAVHEISREERRLIISMNKLDIELYRYAKRRYLMQILQNRFKHMMSAVFSFLRGSQSEIEQDMNLARQNQFETLMLKAWTGNPYDAAQVSPLPYDVQADWGRDNAILRGAVQALRPQRVIEVGTWKGASAIAMCDALKAIDIQPIIMCVDTWGGLEGWRSWVQRPMTERGVPRIVEWWSDKVGETAVQQSWPGDARKFPLFASNVVRRGMDGNIVPMPVEGCTAVDWFRENGVEPDLVHLDATHDHAELLALMHAYWDLLRQGGVMMGMDFHPAHPGVISAVHEFSNARNQAISFWGNIWVIRK